MLSHLLLKYIIIFVISTSLVLLLTPLFITLATRMGLVDHPDERRIHKTVIPLGAGVIIFIGFHLGCFFIYHVLALNVNNPLNLDWWQVFFLASSILLMVGLIDDAWGMSAISKLAGQTLATSTLYFLSGHQVTLLGLDFGLIGGYIFVLLWTLTIVNAFNLIDGLDGLCTGLSLISAIGLAVIFIFRGAVNDALVCLALIGSCLGFLRYNFYPAKVFLGDTGSMFLGFTLASISLQAGGKGSFFMFIASPFFVAGIPIIDTLLAIWRRSMRQLIAKRAGKNRVGIMQADKEHLHHRLLNLGLKQYHVAYTLYAANVAIILLGIFYFIFQDISTGLFLIIFILMSYPLLRYILNIELWETSRLFVQKEEKIAVSRLSFIVYPLFDLSWLIAMVWLAEWISLKGETPSLSIRQWFYFLPFWLAPIFSLLFIFNTYMKVWSKSFFKDYLQLTFTLIIGSLLSFALLMMFTETSQLFLLNQICLFCFLGSIGIIGIRLPQHFLREWGMSHQTINQNLHRKILIYGAGVQGGLYLRERQLKYGHELGQTCVIGFVDDDDRIKNQYTFGLKVLVNIHTIETLLTSYAITEIVLTTPIKEENYHYLYQLTKPLEIKIFKWQAYTTPVI